MCAKNGLQITAPEQLFFRHLLEAWLDPDTGQPSSQGFRPMREEDKGCLSMDMANKTSAASAFMLCSSQPPAGFGNSAHSTWGVSLSELTQATLTVWEDPVGATDRLPANPAHAVVDFTSLGNKAQVRAAQRLKAGAAARGCQHPDRPALEPGREQFFVQSSPEAPRGDGPRHSQ